MDTNGANKNVIVTCNNSGIGENHFALLELSCFPNPAQNQTIIRYTSTAKDGIEVWVTDYMGRYSPVEFQVKNEGIVLYLQALETGTYGFIVSEGDKYVGAGSFIVP
jgi:hypothetical protein